ncbi:hypothetical protein ACFQ4K_00515 [Tistrella bauzanensis]
MTTAQLIPLRSSVSGRRPARSAGLAMLTMLLLSGCGSWWGSDEKPTLGASGLR